MKQRFLVGAALAAATLLAGCGTTAAPAPSVGSGTSGASGGPAEATYTKGAPIKPSDGKQLKIGVTFAVYDQFLQTVADQIKARAAEAGVTVEIVSAEKSTDKQLAQVENFVTQKYDGIIVVPVDTAATGPMTSKVTGAKIPLTYVNRKPADLPANVPYVGSDSIVAGRLEMQELAKQAGAKGNVAILQGDPANEATTMRTKGCQEEAEKAGMKVVATSVGNWERDKALTITENWLQGGQPIAAICSNNDDMALGAIKALTNAGKLKDVKVGGVDATADALTALESGQLAVTVFQDAKGQGSGAVDAIVQLHNGTAVPAFVNVPFQIVTKENVAQFRTK